MLSTDQHPPPIPPKAVEGDEQRHNSLQNLERELAIYRSAIAAGVTQDEINFAAERVATAARSIRANPVQDGPPSYQPPISTPFAMDFSKQSNVHPNDAPRAKIRKQRNSSTSQAVTSDARERTLDQQSDASSIKQKHPAKQVGHGLLLVLVTPVAIAGMSVYACGLILEGGSMILKGAGSIGKKPLQNLWAAVNGKKSPSSRK